MQVGRCCVGVLGGGLGGFGAGRVVEDFAFVVIALAADNSGVVPGLDGAWWTRRAAAAISAEGEHAGVAEALAAAA